MSTPFHLHGKTILITGASSGIGSHTAWRIKEMGGEVVLAGRNEERLMETATKCGVGKEAIVVADITTAEGREHLANAIPAIDGLVNCVGTVHSFPVRFLNPQKIDQTMSVNFEAPVLMTSALLKEKKIKAEGSLVYLSSISSDRPKRGAAMYGASKAAIESFVKVLAQELHTQKIRVNSIAPAMVKTPMYDRAEEFVSKEEMDNHISKYLLGVGYPDDVANAVVYLLSPASRWATGINLILDGGVLL
ncbi:MAG TPA: SDR family oxidoreductase [Bacteroidia bacterium]|nr:SDR family oxidoreductase [Bacteroidia bacterium]